MTYRSKIIVLLIAALMFIGGCERVVTDCKYVTNIATITASDTIYTDSSYVVRDRIVDTDTMKVFANKYHRLALIPDTIEHYTEYEYYSFYGNSSHCDTVLKSKYYTVEQQYIYSMKPTLDSITYDTVCYTQTECN